MVGWWGVKERVGEVGQVEWGGCNRLSDSLFKVSSNKRRRPEESKELRYAEKLLKDMDV